MASEFPIRTRWTLGAVLSAGGVVLAQIQPPQVPDNLKPPATESVLLKALGRGKQIYACQANPQNQSKFEWVLERPQADLLDEHGATIGRHYEGPTWEAGDSKVVGEVQQRAAAPGGHAIPWLLLKAKTASAKGAFAHVTYVQRVNTTGGVAPSEGCDQAHAGKEVAIDYQADYYFYAPQR
jgi:Protein of unknown function (DUF3455)